MTAQGHARTRFRRAVAGGSLSLAEIAARELGTLSLAEALDLCLLYRTEPTRYERAAARWVGRLIEERPGIPLADVEFAAAALREALHDESGEAALRSLLEVGRYAK